MSTEVLRFAPSPTGGFHVGNARTALYNYLYARHYGATLKLRVEDTDRDRNTDAALDTILDGLAWMGIEYDGEPVFQSKNEPAHREAVDQLLTSGAAYRCYADAQELEEIRKQAQKDKRGARFPAATPKEVEQHVANGVNPVVYFRIPPGETTWNDRIRGGSQWDNDVIGDFVIQRSDGTPTYNLAVAVDDHNMGVTFVLRGADHISNTPKQIMLCRALGWDVPQYGHSTLLLGSDGGKLGKRHGATTVTEYREQGYLSSALFNFLALLGWAPGDGREVFSPDELVESFKAEGLLKKDAIFDEAKLLWLNGEHIRTMTGEALLPMAATAWVASGLLEERELESRKPELLRIVAMMQPRVERLSDFEHARYFFVEPDHFDEKALKKHWKTDTPDRLAQYVERLRALDEFDEGVVEGATRTLAGELGLSASKLIHPTRLALCGVSFGPGLFELMEVMGKDTCLRRLDRALAVLPTEQHVS
ncbi:MAG: glutamate--tRNA ligase [Gemmatimonadetes bacterium]|nr:glutamate--tRNA ligase [Gemmatimonadota bacterium]|tara:strand:- start:2503 stop:3936 length:1434 start_codon:yes stop_codon:yes gene_type:complete